MPLLNATLLCIALVLTDLLVRAWRIQWIVQGLGYRIGFRDSLVLNAYGDAACALTPLRIGGEPARLAGMLRSRVPATAAFAARPYSCPLLGLPHSSRRAWAMASATRGSTGVVAL